MIDTLHISNYALIDSLDIEFDSGQNIITGETGSGKSIILGALGLVMGERADLSVIRNPERKTVVEAVFNVKGLDGLKSYLESQNLDYVTEECILRRELTAKGGGRAFVNDTPVTLAVLRQTALMLLDIHTQHQNLLLADHNFQMNILDAFADNADLRNSYAQVYRNYRSKLDEYKMTADILKRNRADADYIAYQLNQLDTLNLKPGEQLELEQRREILANATQITDMLGGAIDALNTGEGVPSYLGQAADRMIRLDDIIGEAATLSERLTAARIEIQDILETLEDYAQQVEANPAELERIQDRLSDIYSLQTKHHVDTDSALIQLREEMRAKLDTIKNGDDMLSACEAAARTAKKEVIFIGRKLTESRQKAAENLSKELTERCKPLGMANIRMEISLTPCKPGSDGMDNVDFLFSFNKNQALMPVGKTASGGEISRVMLALKATVAHSFRLSTMIFDEIDTGVSGDVATRMAMMMADLARETQVITITHLPQVAAYGRRHFKVFKHDDDASTLTSIKALSDEERRNELALMLSGDSTSATALATADTLLSAAIHNR